MKNDSRSLILPARRRLLLAGSLLALGGLAQARRAFAAAEAKTADQHEHHQHEHHQHAPAPEGLKRTEATYTIPGVTMVRKDGAKVAFPAELDDGRPVILDFIYTSCTAVCPVTSQIFSQFQEKLGKDRDKVKMISISIDPEYDTPKRLADFAKKYNAGAQWQHYTGTAQASIAIQKAFDAYRGDKMNHFPVTLMRAAPGKPWVRLEGFATPDVLVREYRELVKGV
jgi:protein SCO1/2